MYFSMSLYIHCWVFGVMPYYVGMTFQRLMCNGFTNYKLECRFIFHTYALLVARVGSMPSRFIVLQKEVNAKMIGKAHEMDL